MEQWLKFPTFFLFSFLINTEVLHFSLHINYSSYPAAYILFFFKISSRIHRYFLPISYDVPIAKNMCFKTSNYNKAMIKVNERDCQNIRNMDFLKLLCLSNEARQNTSIKERGREAKIKMHELKVNYLSPSKRFLNLLVNLVCGFFQHIPCVNRLKYPSQPILWTGRTQMTHMAPLWHLFEPSN